MCELTTALMMGVSAAGTVLGAAQQAQQAQLEAAQQSRRAWQASYQTAYQATQARNAATVSEYNAQDAERRQRAARYEAALGSQTSATVNIERSQAKADAFAKQVTLLSQLLKLAEGIDPTIDVSVRRLASSINGSARDNVLDLLIASKADQARRLDAELKNLVKARSDLATAEQTLAELA